MGLIGNQLFTDLTDRIAKQREYIMSGLEQANRRGGGFLFERVTDADDYDVENALITPLNNIDTNNLNVTEDDRRIYSQAIGAFENHVAQEGASNLDDYLDRSGIQVDDLFARVYNSTMGKELYANNTFGPVVDPMATIAFTSSGVATFTDGGALGEGGTSRHNDIHTVTLPRGNHGDENLEIVVQSGAGSGIGGNDVFLDFICTDKDNSELSQAIMIPASTGPGYVAQVGGSDFKVIDITNVVVAGGSNNDEVIARSKLLRTIAL